MNIRKEFHCARLHRRFTFPLSICLGGQVYSLINWSQGGVLISIPRHILQKDRDTDGELLIPCEDGTYSLPLQLRPLRKTEEGWACQFIDTPPREQAILRFFVEIVLRGDSVLMAELDAAGRIARNPVPPPPAGQSTSSDESKEASSRHFRFPTRFVVLSTVLLTVIGVIAYFTVPYLAGTVRQKLSKSSNLESVAKSRIDSATLALKDLDTKIGMVEKLLASGNSGPGGLNLRSEQTQALEIGLAQLRNQREMAQVHLKVLEENLKLVRQGDFLIEESVFAGYQTDANLSSAPFLGQILTDLAADSRMLPQSEEDRRKFARIAEARLSQARHKRQATRIEREALERIAKRAEQAAAASALPRNTLDRMQRDLELLRIEELRLDDMIILLEENVKAVAAGNFTYELQLLQRFNPETSTEVSNKASTSTQ